MDVNVGEVLVLGAAVDEEAIVEFNVEIEDGVELEVALDMVCISDVLNVVLVDIIVDGVLVVVDDVDVVDVVVDGIVITGIVMFEMGQMMVDV